MSLVQVQVSLSVAALAPWVAPARLQLGYQLGGHTVAHTLPLPLVATKFCSPPAAPLPRELFFLQWRQLAGPPRFHRYPAQMGWPAWFSAIQQVARFGNSDLTWQC